MSDIDELMQVLSAPVRKTRKHIKHASYNVEMTPMMYQRVSRYCRKLGKTVEELTPKEKRELAKLLKRPKREPLLGDRAMTSTERTRLHAWRKKQEKEKADARKSKRRKS